MASLEKLSIPERVKKIEKILRILAILYKREFSALRRYTKSDQILSKEVEELPEIQEIYKGFLEGQILRFKRVSKLLRIYGNKHPVFPFFTSLGIPEDIAGYLLGRIPAREFDYGYSLIKYCGWAKKSVYKNPHGFDRFLKYILWVVSDYLIDNRTRYYDDYIYFKMLGRKCGKDEATVARLSKIFVIQKFLCDYLAYYHRTFGSDITKAYVFVFGRRVYAK